MTEIPVHDIAAEEACLGSILLEGTLIEQSKLLPQDFYHKPLRLVFEGMLYLKGKNAPVNQITLANALEATKRLEEAGGVSYLSHLITVPPTHLDYESYEAIVKDLSWKRRLHSVGETIQELANREGERNELIKQADDLLLDLRKSVGNVSILSPKERADQQYQRYQKLYETNETLAVPTGLTKLDNVMGGGMYPGEMIVVGARPGVGKTTLLQQIANHIGSKEPVLFCTAEMDDAALTDREVSSFLGESIVSIRQGKYSDSLFAKMNDAIAEISESYVYIYKKSRYNPFTTDKIYQACVEMQLRIGLKLVVVDYLGLLRDRYGNSENARISYISAQLKNMAQELDIPVLVAQQLNRHVESREEKRPQLHDLRDSGSVEQDADVVLFLYRKSYYGDTISDDTEILLAKQRQGGNTGVIKVKFNKTKQRYEDL